MSIEIQISCISKSDRQSPYERIQRVGGIGSTGLPWSLTTDEAISKIERGDFIFYVEVNGSRALVEIAISASGQKYLKTRNDGDHPNNLLSLPECL